MEKDVRDVMENYIDIYMAHLPEMLKHHEGKFTIFAGKEPLGFWDTLKEAARKGYRKYGRVPMLIREVSSEYIKYGRYGRPQTYTSRAKF
jgi:hypothetical protein